MGNDKLTKNLAASPESRKTPQRIDTPGLGRRGVRLPQAHGASFWPDALPLHRRAEMAATHTDLRDTSTIVPTPVRRLCVQPRKAIVMPSGGQESWPSGAGRRNPLATNELRGENRPPFGLDPHIRG